MQRQATQSLSQWQTNPLFHGGFWELTGLETSFTDSNFEEISILPIVHTDSVEK